MSRVTESMFFQLGQRMIFRAQNRLLDAQLDAASGLRVHRPADAPAELGRLRNIEQALARLSAGRTASSIAKSQLQASESALAEANNLVVRARELALQGANDAVTPADRQTMARELEGLRAQMLQLANTQVGGVYVFAGFKTDVAPFLSSGAYVGDDGVREVPVLPDFRVAANVSGSQAFTVAGGVDVFATLDALVVALDSNDLATVRATLDSLETAEDQILRQRLAAGVRLSQLDTADSIRATASLVLQSSRSDVRDAQAPEAFGELAQAETALRAALEVAAQVAGMFGK